MIGLVVIVLCLAMGFFGLFMARSAIKDRNRYWKARYEYAKYHRFIEDSADKNPNKNFSSQNQNNNSIKRKRFYRRKNKYLEEGEKNA